MKCKAETAVICIIIKHEKKERSQFIIHSIRANTILRKGNYNLHQKTSRTWSNPFKESSPTQTVYEKALPEQLERTLLWQALKKDGSVGLMKDVLRESNRPYVWNGAQEVAELSSEGLVSATDGTGHLLDLIQYGTGDGVKIHRARSIKHVQYLGDGVAKGLGDLAFLGDELGCGLILGGKVSGGSGESNGRLHTVEDLLIVIYRKERRTK